MAYCFVRHLKPRQVVEVGGGFSTRVIWKALEANRIHDGVSGKLTTIEPHPDRLLDSDVKIPIHLVQKAVQDVGPTLFEDLPESDILFLDSSHVVATGSDTVCEYLDILPRLKPGVVIHAHDIFLPADYPREAVLNRLCFWSEQYLLQDFLSCNPYFEVLWASSAMQIFHRSALQRAFPHWRKSYRNMPKETRSHIPTLDGESVWPSSLWMRHVK